MLRALRKIAFLTGAAAPLACLAAPAQAKPPTAAEALEFRPIQSDADYDRPTAEEVARCQVEVEAVGGISGWVVRNELNQVLRRYLDTNGDNKVDQWCYFKNGIEVYRDIDSNFNNQADQYRWLGTAGTRHGIDTDEDARIDSWKMISPEEVTAEIVAALRERDAARFKRLLLNKTELEALGLGEQQAADLKEKVAAAANSFATVATRQKVVTPQSEWIHFGGSRPGIVPAGKDGSTKDIVVYDNVTAVVETDGKHSQLIVGTLIKIGDNWRIFDLPKNLAGDTASTNVGYFFQASHSKRSDTEEAAPMGGVSAEMQKFIAELEKIDKSLAAARTPTEQSRLNAARADLLERLVKQASTPEDRNIWIRQYAETVSAAVQSGAFPDGAGRLEALLAQVKKMPDSADLAAYVKFRQMTAAYNVSLQAKDVDYEKVNAAWMADLNDFVADYSRSPDAAEAMLQLAIGNEFAGKEEKASEWFGRIVQEFPKSDLATKAAGAKRRLESVGKTLSLKGKTIDGRPLDLAQYSGKVVLIHYWATWCEPCKQDLDTIKELQAKYGKAGFAPIGVNLDSDPREATQFLRSKTLPWPQLYEEGGLESRLADELGILTLPTMILVGSDGRVLNRNISGGELDGELKKQLR